MHQDSLPSDALVCHSLSFSDDWSKIALSLPRSEVTTDWHGTALQQPFRFALGKDAEQLVFIAEAPFAPPPIPPTSTQLLEAFVADLAEPETRGHTAELFLMGREAHYLEIHLSPDGAWWYMKFPNYRQREPAPPPTNVTVWHNRSDDSWCSAIKIPQRALSVPLDDHLKAQVTLALCDRDPPLYATSAGAPSFEPDFHDPRAFRPVIFQ
jgi:hypothetical protein